ncbi:MAG: glycosyltransferase family 2 protein [Arenimonas sp.]|uniref:glycosyltransferase family 2 protein n=1 Tax=Arenimonas sp. TaxID=1872635 RepID=UPI0025BC2F39|nr:glycosyltransferase family A protein [Arenimonas sp.]MBW8368939.1 glycosyltransferase family 2 protein [Arenimonas sp.]
MDTALPHFSILLPTFNRGNLLPRAVASVLAQHESSWELLVADDGSSDGTAEVLAAYRKRDDRVHTWQHANRGQAASRNRLLLEARAPWIAFLDSDDEIEPDHLSRHREAIEAEPAVDIWVSPMRVMGSSMVPCAHNPGQDIHLDHCIGVGMLVLRRELMLAVGGFPDLAYAEESALMRRLLAHGGQRGYLARRSYVYHRNHPESLTREQRLPVAR